MVELFGHVSAIAFGMVSGLVCLAFLHVLGLIVTPNRWRDGITSSALPAAIGAAIFTVAGWYGIKLDVSLVEVGRGLFLVTLILFLLRLWRPGFARFFAGFRLRTAIAFAGQFSLFYILAYLFTLPPVGADYLPIKFSNFDALSYVNLTTYIQRLGIQNVVRFGPQWAREQEVFQRLGFLNLEHVIPNYLATPSAPNFLGLVSTLYGNDAMQAALPVLFSIVALIGTTVVVICERSFSLGRRESILIGGAFVSGQFFRYIYDCYFLAQCLSALLVLLLILKTLEHKTTGKWNAARAMLTFIPYYVSLLYTYVVMFIGAVVIQTGLVVAIQASNMIGNRVGAGYSDTAWRRWLGILAGISCAVGVATVIDPAYTRYAYERVLELSQWQAGWPLGLISPLSLVGIPGIPPVLSTWSVLGTAILFAGPAAGLIYVYCFRFGSRSRAAAKALLLLTVGLYGIYLVYYWHHGYSYQQWKLASYFPLMVSFAIIAVLLELAGGSYRQATGRSSAGFGVWRYAALLGIVAVVAANLAFRLLAHQYESAPGFPSFLALERTHSKIPSSARGLAAVDSIDDRKDIYISSNKIVTPFLAVQFIPQKRLHFLTSSWGYLPSESIDRARLTEDSLVLREGEPCKERGSPVFVNIENVGCLYLAIPKMELGVDYNFSDTWAFLRVEGARWPEAWGRWTEAKIATIDLEIPSQAIVDQSEGYVNLDLVPFLPKGTQVQRVDLRWGEGRAGKTVLSQPSTISLRYGPSDWIAGRTRHFKIAMELPDAISPHDVEPSLAERETLGVGLVRFSVTSAPKGLVIENLVIKKTG